MLPDLLHGSKNTFPKKNGRGGLIPHTQSPTAVGKETLGALGIRSTQFKILPDKAKIGVLQILLGQMSSERTAHTKQMGEFMRWNCSVTEARKNIF